MNEYKELVQTRINQCKKSRKQMRILNTYVNWPLFIVNAMLVLFSMSPEAVHDFYSNLWLYIWFMVAMGATIGINNWLQKTYTKSIKILKTLL